MNTKKEPLKLTRVILQEIMDQTLQVYGYFDILAELLDKESQFYQMEEICAILNSQAFVSKVHPYVNSLLTTTNIGIVIATLKIYEGLESPLSRAKAMKRVKHTINAFTMYQLETNYTSIECDLKLINSIFQKIGLIVRQSQFYFYCQKCWPQGKLQIEHLLPLCFELEEINELKRKLTEWISSDEYEKRFFRRKNSFHSQSKEAEKLKKIKIKYLNPLELLHQIEYHELTIQMPGQAKKLRSFFRKPQIMGEPSVTHEPEDPHEEDEKKFNENVLNGAYIYESIKRELKEGKSLVVQQYKPRVSTSEEDQEQQKILNFVKSTAISLLENQKKDEKYKNEPFMGLANKIFRAR